MILPIDFKAVTHIDYFDIIGKEIDFDDTDNKDMISLKEAESIQKILTCEVSIFLLRDVSGPRFCGSLIDDMVDTRRKFINQYESNFGKDYIEYNEYY